ncbi:MAG: hypothetical protein DRP06_03140 [Candidatus Aenigmatarchaeota archaeon]|nr:MAG: hypothetical protein DRP06_03140 [Candidatus Aenigmarchaeota archaeon]
MFKGVTPVIAIILLTGVTLGGIISAYIGIISLTNDIEYNIEKSVLEEFDARGANLKVDVFGNCKIYLRNTGTKDIPMEAISLYLDDQPVKYEPSTGIIKINNVTEITFSGLNYKRYDVKIKLMGKLLEQGYMICSGGAPVYDFSCSIRHLTCNTGETEILALSALTNGFAELVTEGNYNYLLCCDNISSVKTVPNHDCGGSYTGLISLSGNTNALVEKFNLPGGFTNKTSICVEFNDNARLECTRTTSSNCDSWNWKKLVSASGITNANIGNASAYPNNVLCCTVY